MENTQETSDWTSLKSVYNSTFVCGLSFFFVGFLLPIIAYDSMGASGVQVALIFALLTLGSAVFSPIVGKFAKAGRRRISIFIGASIRGLAYLGMAGAIWINSIDFLILNSLVWGIGAAAYWVGMDAEISERVTRENRTEAFGHRTAANARGNLIGAFLGFWIFFTFGVFTVFIVYAITNFVGGLMVIHDRPPIVEISRPSTQRMKSILGKGVIALVIAAAIDSFVMAFLSPFVELYVLHEITTAVELVALAYLPSGIISAMLGGSIGRYADKANKVLIVSGAALIVSICTFALAFLPQLIILLESTFPILVVGVEGRVIMIAVLFTFQGVAGTSAFMVMSSVLGTAYEGRANEGFGMFEAVMGLARFSGPIVGGILWDTYSPMVPFIVVGFAELLLIPAYYLGMKRYEQVIAEKCEEESSPKTET